MPVCNAISNSRMRWTIASDHSSQGRFFLVAEPSYAGIIFPLLTNQSGGIVLNPLCSLGEAVNQLEECRSHQATTWYVNGVSGRDTNNCLLAN